MRRGRRRGGLAGRWSALRGWDFADDVGGGRPRRRWWRSVRTRAPGSPGSAVGGGRRDRRVGEGVGDDGVGGGGALAWAAGVTPGGALLSPPCQESATYPPSGTSSDPTPLGGVGPRPGLPVRPPQRPVGVGGRRVDARVARRGAVDPADEAGLSLDVGQRVTDVRELGERRSCRRRRRHRPTGRRHRARGSRRPR